MFSINILLYTSRCIEIFRGFIVPTCYRLYITVDIDLHSQLSENLKSHFKALPTSPASHLSTICFSNKRLLFFRMNEKADYFTLPGSHSIILAHWRSICIIPLWHFQELGVNGSPSSSASLNVAQILTRWRLNIPIMWPNEHLILLALSPFDSCSNCLVLTYRRLDSCSLPSPLISSILYSCNQNACKILKYIWTHIFRVIVNGSN